MTTTPIAPVPTAAPATQSLWVASDTGTGARTLAWNATEGDWAVVIMNADESPAVDVSVGGKLPAIQGIAVGALIGSALLLTTGTAVMISALGLSRRQPRRRAREVSSDRAGRVRRGVGEQFTKMAERLRAVFEELMAKAR